jgi:hypothetical protein
MEDRDTSYPLQGLIELDDTYIGGKKKSGKRGRRARSRVPVLVAVETPPRGLWSCGLEQSGITDVLLGKRPSQPETPGGFPYPLRELVSLPVPITGSHFMSPCSLE